MTMGSCNVIHFLPGSAQRAPIRNAPSSRMTSPFSMLFSQIWRTRAANSAGRPSRGGKGTLLPSAPEPRRHACHHRRLENAGRDRHDADAVAGKLAGDRQGHADNPALGGGIGGLADLPVEGGNRGRVDDDAALAFRIRLLFWIAAAASRIMLKVPTRLMPTVRAKLSSRCGPSRPITFSAGATPAQLTRPRRPPKALSAQRQPRALHRPRSVTSAWTWRTTSPRVRGTISRLLRIEIGDRHAPARLHQRAHVAAPRPEPPPVTMKPAPRI
jgi:hypothetical protein